MTLFYHTPCCVSSFKVIFCRAFAYFANSAPKPLFCDYLLTKNAADDIIGVTDNSFKEGDTVQNKYDIAAFIWPSYTGDEPRSRIFWQEGYGEWQTVKAMKPMYPGHEWPRKPLWGYVNEADPYVMEMEINAAADHGVNVFIYDWYWYDNRPFLEQCLDNGYLRAKNNDRVKFYLMWANHTATSLWDKRTAELNTPIWNGDVTRDVFDTIVHRTIEKYFSHPSYYKIDGKPVYMIYDLANLVNGLGGIKNTRKALEYFREETVKAGFPGLELQLTLRGQSYCNTTGLDPAFEGNTVSAIHEVGFDSVVHYQFVHFANMGRDYGEILDDVKREWDYIDRNFKIPYYPHVSVGWDANPRFNSLKGNVCKGNTPEAVRKAFEMAKEYVDTHSSLKAPLITVNSWNEWTETSYLEPDDLYGYGYLDVIRSVFKEN